MTKGAGFCVVQEFILDIDHGLTNWAVLLTLVSIPLPSPYINTSENAALS
jgi:hypothetical protein